MTNKERIGRLEKAANLALSVAESLDGQSFKCRVCGHRHWQRPAQFKAGEMLAGAHRRLVSVAAKILEMDGAFNDPVALVGQDVPTGGAFESVCGEPIDQPKEK